MIYLADILHLPGADAGHPAWDTLLALRNKYTSLVTARIRLWNDDGSVVMWPHFSGGGLDDHCDVILQPGLAWAASFIPGNGFTQAEGASAGAPQNFAGRGTIQCFSGVFDQTSNVLVFTLLANNAWKYGCNSPVRKDNSGASAFTGKQLWQFAYAIPHFDDTHGDTGKVWSTGVAIENFETIAVPVSLTYTIGQTYPQAGAVYKLQFAVPANGGVRFDLLTGNPGQNVPGLESVGYPSAFNSEGHIDISSTSPAQLYPSLIIASTDYSFTVGVDFAE
jgi:hypothetical protein